MNFTGAKSILDKIVDQTKEDLSSRKKKVSFQDFESFENFERGRRDFRKALRNDEVKEQPVAVIAEIKKASPSKGIIRADFNHLKIADQYEQAGAAAISVLTDKPFFQGELKFLEEISNNTSIPLLRKDFIIDPYQVKEARAYGADAVLLIASITGGSQLEELLHAAAEHELDALVECYSREEVESLQWEKIEILGVNNRDLNTFEVNLHRGVELLNLAPEEIVKVSESGLASPEDLNFLSESGIDAALIGEHFMRQADPGEALKKMLFN